MLDTMLGSICVMILFITKALGKHKERISKSETEGTTSVLTVLTVSVW